MKASNKFVFTCCLFQAVLCREFIISLPESVEALRGLCVLIPCSFDFREEYDVDLQNNPRGIWYKGESQAKYKVYSSKNTEGNKIEGHFLGDLQRKNCTTVFYNISDSDSGDYYFRIVSGNLKYIYSASLYLNIRASPISPSIKMYKEYQGELELQDEVLEGTSLSLICSARSPCPFNPPFFSWNHLPDERRPKENHNTRFSFSQLNFIATHLYHGLQFTCTATYQLQSQNKSAQSSHTLQILYAPRNTLISASPSASLLLGSSVSLSCRSDANPAVLNYTWYRENEDPIGSGNHLKINTTDSTHSGLYYCRAQNQHGYQKASVHLDLQYAPKVSSTSSCSSAQGLITCFCEVHGNPPPTLVWHLSGETVLSAETTPIREESVGDTDLKSFITLHPSFIDTPTLQCIGVNKLGVDTHLFNPFKSECRHTTLNYLVLSLSVVLLLSFGIISCLICKLKQLSGKVKVLMSGNMYTSLQPSAPNTYEILQPHRERRLQDNKV